MHETHIGLVLLLGDRAYKIKKPVRMPFCDFSTSDLRRTAIRRELRLNRRLAPDVYLGTAELTGEGCTEPVLVMRRMPEHRRLSTLLTGGVDVSADLRRLARSLAAFHSGAARSAVITADGGTDALRERWAANLSELEPFRSRPLDPHVLDLVDSLAPRFLAGRAALFARRAAEGRIVDGHGDLLADDVFCLDDGPRALDCLDFDDRLRHVDGLDDVAFLAMDLERLGAPLAAERFLSSYATFAGDPAPPALVHHFIAYRAGVRAKVACLRHAQDATCGAGSGAMRLLDLCAAHLRSGAPRLALVGGLPGTGKSTLAAGLADAVGAVLISSDHLRKELAGMTPPESAAAEFETGLYTRARTTEVYRQMLERAAVLLTLGESVVLDASWTNSSARVAARRTATTQVAELVQLCCTAPGDVAAARIRARHGSASDATPAIAERMAAAMDDWPEAARIDTVSAPADCLRTALRHWEVAVETPHTVS
ncbi:bifunctional aminoglycoside phosphotransferase/ATP-binding protein [Pseudonocardia sp. N23]|uniref:bifunctional aminoglycoside phosphotransferase/ATP-binding protein n=1 Tax=Pseudonocardia sp. N23 TaxID=1987376 RepID=UPI000BFB60EF|nr:bifunctional aminoglycoside phosphotransferase/ATP-binding protein [Pseudonocardia sp. N23]